MDRARKARDARLRAQYNISADEWDEILAYQGGFCPICDRSVGDGGKPLLWNTDHDHKTGLIRGILCVNCNRHLKEFWTIERVGNALMYLETPPASQALGEPRYGRKGRITNKRKRKKATSKTRRATRKK